MISRIENYKKESTKFFGHEKLMIKLENVRMLESRLKVSENNYSLGLCRGLDLVRLL